MLNSTEHVISNGHKFKYINKFSFFSGSDKSRMLFFQLINVKMPTIVGILTFMSRKIVMLSSVEHEKKFHNLAAWAILKYQCLRYRELTMYVFSFSKDKLYSVL